MSKISSIVSGLVSRRSYGVYTRAVNVQGSGSAAAAVAKAKADTVAAADASNNKQQDKFWMRDPMTGCWTPENRFQEVDVDVVDLRNRLIRHK